MDNLKRKLKLSDLLAYLEGDEVIQIVNEVADEWDHYTNIEAGSILLAPFYEWDVICMGAEFYTDEPVIRVSIKQPRITPHQSA